MIASGTTVRTLRNPRRLGRVQEIVETPRMRARVWFPYENKFDGDFWPSYVQHHDLTNLEVCCGPLQRGGR
jgi:hypothetical protein